jgi:hypothetical protein
MKEVKLSDVKVGDILWAWSEWTNKSYPKVVTKVTKSMVYSKAYKLMDDWHLVNSPKAVENAVKVLGLKGVTTNGDMYNGGASIPLAGNECCFELGVEQKEKKTYKRRGVVRDNIGYLLDPLTATIEYDFYLG